MEHKPAVLAIDLSSRPAQVLYLAANGMMEGVEKLRARANDDATPQALLADVADLLVDLSDLVSRAALVAVEREHRQRAEKSRNN